MNFNCTSFGILFEFRFVLLFLILSSCEFGKNSFISSKSGGGGEDPIFFAPSTINVGIEATSIVESNASINVRFYIAQVSASPITVSFSITGTAIPNAVDYSSHSVYSAIIPAGQTQVLYPLNILDDAFSENDETITLTVDSVTNNYLSDAPSVSLTIIDNDSTGPLTAIPSVLQINPGSRWQINSSGGTGPFTFAVIAGNGTIDTTGRYQNLGQADTIRITDFLGNQVTTTVTLITTPFTSNDICYSSSGQFYGELFDDGGSGGNYSNNQNCSFVVDPGLSQAKYRVEFQSFNLETSFDKLKIYSGVVDAINFLTEYTGNIIPGIVTVNSSKIGFNFSSDSSLVLSGFSLRWYLIEAPLKLVSNNSLYLVDGDSTDLMAIGGHGPFTFSIVSGGGTLTPSLTDPQISTYTATPMSQDVVVRVTDALGATSDITLYVYPTVYLASLTSSVLDSVGTTSITIQMDAASDQAISVPLQFTGTAIPGLHYMMPATSINIPAGQVTVNLPITILNAPGYDPTKTVIVTIGTPTNSNLGYPSEHILSIRDTSMTTTLALDTDFQGTGIYNLDGSSGSDDFAYKVAVDSVDRIVVTGMTNNWGSARDMTLVRFLSSDGSLDTSFNGSGMINYNATNYDHGHDVKILPGDKIFVSGYREWSGRDAPTLWIYNANGTLDTSFSGDGITAGSYPGIEIEGRHSIQTPDGGYLVVGAQYANYLALTKFTAAGALDATFDGDGKATFSSWTECFAKSGGVDSLGKIFIVGQCKPRGSGTDLDMVIWKYNSNGSLDTTFGGVGYVAFDGTGGQAGKSEAASGLLIDGSDNIYITGYAVKSDDRSDMAIWKVIGATGALDTTFNSVGFLLHNGAGNGTSSASGEVIKLDGLGRLLIGGRSAALKGNDDMTLWRFSTTGVIDTTFTNLGFYYHSSAAGGNGHDGINDFTFDSANRLIVAGQSIAANGYSNFVVLVFEGY